MATASSAVNTALTGTSYQSVALKRQAAFITGLSFIGLAGLILYSSIDINYGRFNELYGTVPLAVLYISLFFIVRSGRVELAARLITLIGGVGYFLVGYNDRIGDSGLFLFNTYPILAFFLLGKRQGAAWTAIFTIVMVVYYLLHLYGIIHLSYSEAAFRDFIVSFAITVIMIYFYQDLVSTGEKIIESRDRSLAEERDQANAVVTAIGEGVFVIDQDQRIISQNPIASKLLGVSTAQAFKHPIQDIFQLYKERKKLTTEEHPAIASVHSGQIVTVNLEDDIYGIATGGGRFPVSIVSAPLSHNDHIYGAVIVFRDVTQDKQAGEIIERQVQERTLEVRQAQARLIASIESLKIGYIMTDNQNNIVTSNTATRQILSPQQPLHEATTPVVSLSLDTINKIIGVNLNLIDTIKKCMDERRSYEFNDVAYGSKFLHLYLSPIVASDQVIGTVLLIEDVTEEKALQRSRDEFFSIASHELRTPLTAIRGYTSLMSKIYADKVADPQFATMLKSVHNACIRLINIVNDFLDTSRLEQGRIKFNKEKFSLASLTEEVLGELQTSATQQQNLLRFQDIKNSDQLTVCADKDRVKQILVNLVGNAIKFTKNGTITVSVKGSKELIQVLITDTGIGIPPKNQGLLFRKFQQAGDSIYARDVSQGTGLGLYISRLLAQGMGGNVELVASEVGKGSTFALSLPPVS